MPVLNETYAHHLSTEVYILILVASKTGFLVSFLEGAKGHHHVKQEMRSYSLGVS